MQFTRRGDIRNAGIAVSYADNDLTDPVSCNETQVVGALYKQVGSTWTAVAATSIAGANWVGGGPSGFCVLPSIFFDGPTKLTYHKNYRVVAQAGRVFSNGTFVTRKVRITTDYAVNQPQ